MSVKSTVDVDVDQARAFFRAMIPADPQIEDELFEHIEGDGWMPDPVLDRRFLEMLRGDDEITDLDHVYHSIEHVLEAAFDMINHGEGNRNFFLCFGEYRRRPEPLDMGNLVDLNIKGLIDEGMQDASRQPSM